MEIKVLSKIIDKKINALNVLIELKIKDYISLVNDIIDQNEMQRRRIKSSKTVYSLLRNDLRDGCTIPPIFLAIKKDAIEENATLEQIENFTDNKLEELINTKQLLILDGLQRTYQILELEDILKKENDAKTLEFIYERKIRAEIYIGINKMGILYRMLTLNTGQTPMSARHQIEILYQDYLGDNKIPGINLFKEVDGTKDIKFGNYRFNEIIDGFQSYLEKDELAIDRVAILEEVKTIEKISKVGQSRELFKDFVMAYHHFLSKMLEIGKGWQLEKGDDFFNKVPQPFATNTEAIFLRSQIMTGFGAALGSLEDSGIIANLNSINKQINTIELGGELDETFKNLLLNLESIRKTSKKIGNSQRRYFYFLFRSLFGVGGDSHLNLKKSTDRAFQNYKTEFL